MNKTIIKNILKTVASKLNLNQDNLENAYNNTLPHLNNIKNKEDAQAVLKKLGVNKDFINNKMLPMLHNTNAQQIARNFGINLTGVENQIKSLFGDSNNNNNISNINNINNSNNIDQLSKLKNSLDKLK